MLAEELCQPSQADGRTREQMDMVRKIGCPPGWDILGRRILTQELAGDRPYNCC